MKIVRISSENFLLWRKLLIAFQKLMNFIGISGPNGSGKTSMMYIVPACLYKSIPRVGVGDDISKFVSRGQGKMKLEVDILKLGVLYRVKRTLSGKKHTLGIFEVKSSGEEIPLSGDITSAQKKIDELFGSYMTFMSSTFASQGRSEGFLSADKADRRDIIIEILSLSKYKDRYKIAKEKNKILRDNIANLEIKKQVLLDNLESLSQEIKISDIEELKKEKAANKATLVIEEKKEKELSHKISSYDERKNRFFSHKKIIDENKLKIVEERKQLAEFQVVIGNKDKIRQQEAKISQLKEDENFYINARSREQELKNEIARLELIISNADADRVSQLRVIENAIAVKKSQRQAEINALEKVITAEQARVTYEIARVDQQISFLSKDIDKINNSRCPLITAGQQPNCVFLEAAMQSPTKIKELEISKQVLVNSVICAAEKEQLTHLQLPISYEEEAQSVQLNAPVCVMERESVVKLKSDLAGVGYDAAAHKKYNESVDAYILAINKNVAFLQKAEDLSGAIQSRIIEREAIISENQGAINQLKYDSKESVVLDGRKKQVDDKIDSLKNTIDNITSNIAVAESSKKKSVDIQLQIKQHDQDISQESGKLACQSHYEDMTKEDGIPKMIYTAELPYIENEVNKVLEKLDAEFTFVLKTDKETKKGTIKDVLDAFVIKNNYEFIFSEMSGGEQVILQLAFNIGLNNYFALSLGDSWEQIVIDEIVALDEKNLEIVKNVLLKLSDEFQIMLISHSDILKGIGTNDIKVIPGVEGSTYKV